MNKLLALFIFCSFLLVGTLYSNAGNGGPPPPDLGEGNGCSALSDPNIDCSDLDIVFEGPQEFCGTMGLKGIQVRSNNSNDTDTDGESDGIEECICDALDDNPNININPGDGSVCDSSVPAERDQFVGDCTIGSQIRGNKYNFCYTFTSFPNSICLQFD